MPSKNNLVKAQRPEMVKVEDIEDADDVKTLPGGGMIEFPYRIKIVDTDAAIVCNEVSTSKVFSSEWDSNFYERKGRTSYTRNAELLALCKLLEKLEPDAFSNAFDKSGSFDVNKLIGFAFEAVIVRLPSGNNFIDWAATFRINGIEVPKLEAREEQVESEEQSEEINPNDLPF